MLKSSWFSIKTLDNDWWRTEITEVRLIWCFKLEPHNSCLLLFVRVLFSKVSKNDFFHNHHFSSPKKFDVSSKIQFSESFLQKKNVIKIKLRSIKYKFKKFWQLVNQFYFFFEMSSNFTIPDIYLNDFSGLKKTSSWKTMDSLPSRFLHPGSPPQW